MKSILIVEDDRVTASSIKSILRNLGYQKTYIAESGVKALKIIEEKHPDLILADIVLEGKMSGIELAQQVKKKYSIPLIFVTAYSDEGTVNKAKLAEPYGYITKPIQQKDLKIAVDIAFYKFKMEQKLKENETKLKTILHTMPSGLFTTDLNRKIITWNKEAETITGLKAKETIGKFCLQIFNCEECKKGCLLFDDDVDKPIYHKESVIHINEREIALLKNEDILKDLDGNIIGGIVSFIDITERKQAENELRKEKRFTKNIIATIPDSLLVIDKNLKIKSANHTFYETFQMEPEKVVGASITNILGNENRRLITELTKLFGTEEMLENFELHYQSKKMGSPREVRKLISKGERIFNITARGIIIAEEEEEEEELVVLHDITERKKAGEKIQKLSKVVETTPEAVVITDMQGKIEYVNRGLLTLGGFEDDNLIIGKSIFLFTNEEGVKQLKEEIIPTILSKGKWRGEISVKRKDSSIFPVEMICSCILDVKGNPKNLLSQYRDITERKQATEKIRESEEKYRSLTETVSDGIFTLDLKSKFTFLSSAFEKITGFQTKDYLGHRFKDILVPEYIDSTSNRFKRGIAGEEIPLYEIELLHKEKGTVPIELSVTSLYDKNENIAGSIGSFRDITERKNSEQELKNAYSELENTQNELIQSQTLAALGGFASGVAHEIRNPLANISASAQYCLKTFDFTGKVKNYMRIIIRNSNKANRIIKDLLDFARPRELVFKQGNILHPLNKACELTKAKRFNNNIRLYKRCSRVLPKILMDEKRMEQVFLNIIINSIDSMSKGGRLSITAYSEKEYVVINISDTGKGISTQDISKIFNPFFTKKSDGVGLGLSVTHRIIQSHKGKIEVESEYNKGTKFIIILPIVNDKK